jgi:hypothetical protein
MSYLVLALGALLSLCGAIAIYVGYGIILVERGWAFFIGGSVAFSCGIVTLALGFILHRLTSLHASLTSRKGFTLPPRELSRRTAGEPHREYSPLVPPGDSMMPVAVPPTAAAPPTAIPPAGGVRSWPQRPMRSNLAAARNLLKPRGTVLPAPRGTAESDHSSPNIPPFARGGLTAQTVAEPPFEPGFGMPAEVAAVKAEDKAETEPAFAPAGETSAERAWREGGEPGLFDEAMAGDKIEEPPAGQILPEMRDGPGVPEAQSGRDMDWPAGTASIDRIFEEELFIELDKALESRTGGAEPSAEPIEPASLDLAPPVESESEAEAGTAAVEDPLLEPPPDVSGAGQQELTVLGQYESGGTAYVMYSDGSIEARTQRAVFHFKSMAELKAFMESEARTSQE